MWSWNNSPEDEDEWNEQQAAQEAEYDRWLWRQLDR